MTKEKIIGVICDFDKGGDNKYSHSNYYATKISYIEALNSYDNIAPILIPYKYSSIDAYINIIDGLMITGGRIDINPAKYNSDFIHPEATLNNDRGDFEHEFLLRLLNKSKKYVPIFGICNGMQLINVVCGGTIDQHILDNKNYMDHEQSHHKDYTDYSKPYHKILFDRNSNLSQFISNHLPINDQFEFMTNSSHHQAIENLGKNITASAKSSDGIIEAIEKKDHKFCIGVQWHPEFFSSEIDKILFDLFIDAINDS